MMNSQTNAEAGKRGKAGVNRGSSRELSDIRSHSFAGKFVATWTSTGCNSNGISSVLCPGFENIRGRLLGNANSRLPLQQMSLSISAVSNQLSAAKQNLQRLFINK